MLGFLDDTITDSHFLQRDRMGRTMAFMAVMESWEEVGGPARAIGVNEQTALLIDENGLAAVVGNPYSKKLAPADQQRSVYLMEGLTAVGDLSAPLSYSVSVRRLSDDPLDPLSLDDPRAWQPLWSSEPGYTVTAADGRLISSVVYG